ncbi:ATP-grasp domain-containing protein [Hansschlegelia plantiphila]|nr:ATP-grasp domain-containing protein [Hansschlegelia plantiphila]
MAGEPISPSLAREGALMRDALARDLTDIPGVSLVTTHDERLTPPRGIASIAIAPERDLWRLWAYCARKVDVTWVVAPETGGVLARLTGLCANAGAIGIGPDIEAIRVASSKKLTAETLIAAGVPALPVWASNAVPDDVLGPFVAKPDDGAGCESTLLMLDRPEPGSLGSGHVLQLFAAGEAASLTVLSAGGTVRLLSANRQHVAVENGRFVFRGLTLGALGDDDNALQQLAEMVVDAIPGLSGIFGIDVVIGNSGPVVVEVNPRLTTSYAGLREAIGINPVSLVAPFAGDACVGLPTSPARQVEIAL